MRSRVICRATSAVNSSSYNSLTCHFAFINVLSYVTLNDMSDRYTSSTWAFFSNFRHACCHYFRDNTLTIRKLVTDSSRNIYFFAIDIKSPHNGTSRWHYLSTVWFSHLACYIVALPVSVICKIYTYHFRILICKRVTYANTLSLPLSGRFIFGWLFLWWWLSL